MAEMIDEVEVVGPGVVGVEEDNVRGGRVGGLRGEVRKVGVWGKQWGWELGEVR